MTTCRSDEEAAIPFRLASMTRRQTSTVAWSPRSLAASRTIQAASSGFASPETTPKRSDAPAPNEIAFIADISPKTRAAISLHQKCGVGFGIRIPGTFARLIEFQNSPRCLDIEAAKLAFEVIQIVCGD